MSAVTTELVGDSPAPPSAQSNFRELDDAFLQTQARIWLGEVLKIRFDEQVNISDLLADGELLFEASEAISKMLPTLSMDDTQLKVYEWKPLASNKSTRIYMPYYNVDSFLRMCKNLGLDGIDLFTPSDVVERRNTRKVCMCLRSLSKKAKLGDLNVPDFDSVTCTLAMPTDKVEYIRKSLEMSQSSSSLSVEQEVEKASRVRYWRRMSNSASAHSNHHSDDCDEAESHFAFDESHGSSDYANDAESPNMLGSQVVKNEDGNQCEYLLVPDAESVGSPCSQYYSDEDLSMPASDCQGSRVSGKDPELYSETDLGYRNGNLSHVPIDWEDSHLDDGIYIDGNGDDELDCVSYDKEDSDPACFHCIHSNGNDMRNVHLQNLDDPSKVEFDKNMELGESPEYPINGDGEAKKSSHEGALICEVDPGVGESHPNVESNEKDLLSELSKQSSNISNPLENLACTDNSENHALKPCTEVTNVERESCSDGLFNGNGIEDLSGQLKFLEEKALCSIGYREQNRCSSLLDVKLNGDDNHWDPVRIVDHSRASIPLLLEVDTIICGDVPYSQIEEKEQFGDNKIYPNHSKQYSDKGLSDGSLNNLLDIPHMDLNSSPDVVPLKNNMKFYEDCDGAMGSNDQNSLCESVNGKPTNIDDIILVDAFATTSFDLQLETQSAKHVEDESHRSHQCVEEVDKGQSEVSKQEGTDKELPLTMPRRKLLESVVKGTALLGLAVFLFHLRNNRRDSHSEAKKQQTRLVKHGTPKPLQKSGSITSVYPAEKLRLGI